MYEQLALEAFACVGLISLIGAAGYIFWQLGAAITTSTISVVMIICAATLASYKERCAEYGCHIDPLAFILYGLGLTIGIAYWIIRWVKWANGW